MPKLFDYEIREGFSVCLELTAWRIAANVTLGINLAFCTSLVMHLREQCALVKVLLARWYIYSRILVEEVHRLHCNFDYFAGHHWKVFNTRNLYRCQ